MIKEIVKAPNPVLSTPSSKVLEFDDSILALAEDLLDTMLCIPTAVGLAAPQIGVNLRAFAINYGPVTDVAFNPKIIKRDVTCAPEWDTEACLSVENTHVNIRRTQMILVEYQDKTGNVNKTILTDFLARIFQHEMDHINGWLITDHLDKKEIKL